MCDWRPNFEALEKRVDGIDSRLTKVETTLGEVRKSVEGGIADLKQQIFVLYQERAEWGKWLRGAITAVGQWLGRWGGIIILAALGLSNFKTISEVIKSW